MKRNKKIDVLKFFALFSIICAHLSPVDSSKLLATKFSFLLNSIGAFGVGIFFIISGYFFQQNNESMLIFFKKKSRILIPWIFIGTLVYLAVFYNCLSIKDYICFMLGYGSYLYYLTVLMLLYLIYFRYKNNQLFLILTSLLSISAIIFTSILGYTKFAYLFILNWCIYFSIGILISKMNLIDKIEMIAKKYFSFSLLIIIFDIAIHFYLNYPFGYWSYDGFIIIFINSLMLLGFINFINIDKCNFIIYCGENSLAFYLIHMPIAGIIVRVTNLFDYSLLVLVRPFLTLLITFLIIRLYDIIITRLGLLKLKKMIGVR